MSKKTHELKLQLNAIVESSLNPTLKEASFIVLDTGESGNRQVIEKDTLDNAIKKLNHIPILAKYMPVSEGGAKDDNFGDHEPIMNEDRDGNEFIDTDTLAIGHFITDGEYEDVDGLKVVVANSVLYADKYPNQIALLEELIASGIKINTSCEYYYSKNNAEIIDGVEYIGGEIIFVGHTILGSNPDSENGVVDGAYESSNMLSMNKKIEWNKSLNQAINGQKSSYNKKDKEGEGMEMFKKMNQLSHDAIEAQLYSHLEKVMSDEEYWSAWIPYDGVYDDYFIITMDVEGIRGYYKIPYTKSESDVEINYEAKEKAIRDWTVVQNQLKEVTDSLAKSENLLKTANESLIVESHNKKQAEDKLCEATDKILTMNTKLETLSEIEKQFNDAEKEKALNARRDEFEPKFKKVNALEVFETEDVQKMILNSLEDESIVASLNSMIVDLIPEIEAKEDILDKSENSKKEGLISGLAKSINDLVPEKEEDILSKYILED